MQICQICRICGAEGHLKANCPERDNKPCFLCGVRGHESRNCPNQLCWHCGKPGHQARDCEDRRKGKPAVGRDSGAKGGRERKGRGSHIRFDGGGKAVEQLRASEDGLGAA